jgi:hypothetical protein
VLVAECYNTLILKKYSAKMQNELNNLKAVPSWKVFGRGDEFSV